jgi:hypothetical protein
MYANIKMKQFAVLFTFLLLLVSTVSSLGQSTYGSILGTVKDPNGLLAPNVQVKLTNTGTGAVRTAITDSDGNYTFSNIDVGIYDISFSAKGYQSSTVKGIDLTARETSRVDASMKLASANQTVLVIESVAGTNVINTDESGLAQTKVARELELLPVSISSRAMGTTSPLATLTTEPGVQTDPTGYLLISGTSPSLQSTTLDGIASMSVEYSGPSSELFPSFDSIEEIRVSETNNNAEYSGVADITTVSRAGTNKYHGGVYEYLENTVLNSGFPTAIAATKPVIIMNDFGATSGGPVQLPGYNGHDKTFFFLSYEGLRYINNVPTTLDVPSNEMRSGNLTNYLAGQGISTVYYPDGTPIDPTNVPINSISANILHYLFPAPNYGDPSSYANNFQYNSPERISNNQGDARFDHTISSKQNLFARFSYKNRQVTESPTLGCGLGFCQNAGGPLPGPYSAPEVDEGLTFAYNYIFSQGLLNEFRGGFNAHRGSINQNFSTTQLLSELGLTVPDPDTQWAEAPLIGITGFLFPGNGNPTRLRSQFVQVLDNLTWIKGKHNFKFGADFKRISDHDDNVNGNYRSGWYVFNGSSAVGTTIGDPYTEFLLGYPDSTTVSTVNKLDMNGVGYSQAYYAQDDWKVSSRLTINAGLRYELHPPLTDTGNNTGYFLPNYSTSTSEGTVNGAIVVPNTTALGYVPSGLANSIAPTPFLTASQAGIPQSLRYTYKYDFGPRIGFAWRPFGNDKSVIRGGWGRFFETPLGFSLVSGFGDEASFVPTYTQGYASDNITPLLSFSNPFNTAGLGDTTGLSDFYWAFPVHYIDPSVQQWNLTFERDLGHHIGARFTYVGSHGSNLETIINLNQVPANTAGYLGQYNGPPATGACLTFVNDGSTQDATTVAGHRPYPCWSWIMDVTNSAESNYNSGTIDISKRSGKGLNFDVSYVFTRHLSDDLGSTPNGGLGGVTGGAAGGSWQTDRFHPGLDYGNVNFDRRHRFLATYIYEFPFGKGERWLNNNSLLNGIVGNWKLSGVTVLQSGPFLTPSEASTDPGGTNVLNVVGLTRANIIPHTSLYASPRTVNQWLNPAAFGIPANNQGFFGNAGVGSVVGPGTQTWSMSLLKEITLTRSVKFGLGVEAANLFNHRNYAPPVMQVDAPNFGSITALQPTEGGGPRNLAIEAHINF